MKKITLIGASWCPVTAQAKKFWQGMQRRYVFDYEFIDIESEKGKDLVKKHSIVAIPKTIVGDEIVFHGVPEERKAERLIKQG